MPDKRPVRILSKGNHVPDVTVTLARAEALVASGRYEWTGDGTRSIREVWRARRGDARIWRKVTNRTGLGASMYSSMQLVPGVQGGRNTGGPKAR